MVGRWNGAQPGDLGPETLNLGLRALPRQLLLLPTKLAMQATINFGVET
jgi:hypothetical protein